MIPIPGHNITLNHDSGSKFNVELIPRVIIQRGIKTRGHNSTGGPNFIRRRGRNSMTPCLWGRNSTWKIRWILSTARWIKTPRVEIQWGQHSILHRHVAFTCVCIMMITFGLWRRIILRTSEPVLLYINKCLFCFIFKGWYYVCKRSYVFL